MNRLHDFGVNKQTSHSEFVDRLSAFSLDSLKSLRSDLFHELSSLDVMPADLIGIPLVSRHDSALCPLSQILSQDCWTLCDCILNKNPLPRTLLRNGKKERSFVASQHHPSAEDRISLYEQAVALVIHPLLNIKDQSIENINDEICFVCQMLFSSAQSYLPLNKHNKKKRKFFNSPKLKDLCRASKKAWSAWNACGRPLSGQTYLTKKENKLCASQIQENIQRRDKMFKEKDHRRFKCPNIPNVCGKLATDDGQTTDPFEILSTFQKYHPYPHHRWLKTKLNR